MQICCKVRMQRAYTILSGGQQDGLVVDAVNRFVGVLDERDVPYIYRKGDGNHERDNWERHLDDAFSFLAGIEPGTKNRLVLGDFG